MENYPHPPKTSPDDEVLGWAIGIGTFLVFVALMWFDHPWAAIGVISFVYGAGIGIGMNCGDHRWCCRTPKPRNFWRD